MPTSSELQQATDIEQRTINTIRFLAADAVERASSGHPGTPMGVAPMGYVLWKRHLRFNPQDPAWPNRDRFVLSAGHASMLQYALLHLTGYDLPMEEIKNFRQLHSITPGHPENFLTPGVETTTGPLGQGFANGVGMAIAERMLAAKFNEPDFPVIDHYTYAICSDGDLMEGIASEAASLAGHLGLGKLIYFYDQNYITIDGSTDLAFTEDVGKRFEAYDWHVLHVEDGNDLEALDDALQAAQAETERPSLIKVKTQIGFGSPNKQGTAEAHGAPLGAEELRLAKQNLGWPEDQHFHVPEEVRTHMDARERGRELQQEWEQLFDRYAEAHPEKAARYRSWLAGELPEDWEESVPTFEAGKKLASRAASGKVLDKLAPTVGCLVGGSADLSGSNKTTVDGRIPFQKDNPTGTYFHFGVREHAMAGACNGMSAHGELRPYCGTFLIFSDYLRPSLRLSALMEKPVIYVFTHDSIGLGEDGPTHQPIEHLMALRAIPNHVLIRPADANEVGEAWKAALRRTEGPTSIVLTRQGLPTFDREQLAPAEGLHRGAYILSDSDATPELILIATGSEVQHAQEAAETLRADGTPTRVVSMPSWELFQAQPEDYRREVLPTTVKNRISMEAGATFGWERYVGARGLALGIDRFGASAPGGVLMQKFGFTAEHLVEKARALLRRAQGANL